MPLTTTAAHSLALLIFNNTTYANVGDATGLVGSTGAGSLYGALFTADPTVSGVYTNEATYTGYNASTHPGLARSGAGWTVGTGGAVSNAAALTFGACTASSSTITYCAIILGAGATPGMLSYGTTNALAVSAGITPSFAISALTWTLT
jgi:hypothetical protein